MLSCRLGVVEKSVANLFYRRRGALKVCGHCLMHMNTEHIGALHALSINHHKSHINAGAIGQFSSGKHCHSSLHSLQVVTRVGDGKRRVVSLVAAEYLILIGDCCPCC